MFDSSISHIKDAIDLRVVVRGHAVIFGAHGGFMLATDGFWRACVATHCVDTPDRFWFAACCFIERIQQTHAINEARQWPRPTSEDVPVEHVREAQ